MNRLLLVAGLSVLTFGLGIAVPASADHDRDAIPIVRHQDGRKPDSHKANPKASKKHRAKAVSHRRNAFRPAELKHDRQYPRAAKPGVAEHGVQAHGNPPQASGKAHSDVKPGERAHGQPSGDAPKAGQRDRDRRDMPLRK